MIYDIIVIGGGIVGLATGMKIKQQRPDLSIAILEKENAVAQHQTGNNSGVIHSGLYYKPGSLKATNCIRGYHELVQFCEAENIPFEITGKVVVATRKEQIPLLNRLFERGKQNCLEAIRQITLDELRELEPYCAGVAALHVPQTGIVDYKKVAEVYARKLKESGGLIFLGQKVINIRQQASINYIETDKDIFQSRVIINCAGLYSDKVADMTGLDPEDV